MTVLGKTMEKMKKHLQNIVIVWIVAWTIAWMISDRADMVGCFLCQELLWNPTRKCATEKDHITPLFYGSFHLFNAIWEPAKKEHCRKAMFIFWKYVPYLTQVGWVLGTPNVTHGKSVGSYSKLYSKSIIFPCSWNVKNHANSLHLCSFACPL